MAKGMLDRIRAAVGSGPGPTNPEVVAQPTKTRAELLAEIASERPALEEGLEAKAALFATQLVTGSVVPPAVHFHVATEMLTAMADDAQYGGTVVFAGPKGDEVEGTRTDQVKAKYEAWPKHTLAQTRINAVQAGEVKPMVLKEVADVKRPSEDGDHGVETMTDEQLLASSPLGQRTLEARKQDNRASR